MDQPTLKDAIEPLHKDAIEPLHKDAIEPHTRTTMLNISTPPSWAAYAHERGHRLIDTLPGGNFVGQCVVCGLQQTVVLRQLVYGPLVCPAHGTLRGRVALLAVMGHLLSIPEVAAKYNLRERVVRKRHEARKAALKAAGWPRNPAPTTGAGAYSDGDVVFGPDIWPAIAKFWAVHGN